MPQKRFDRKSSKTGRRWQKRSDRIAKWWARKSEWLQGLFIFLATYVRGAWHFFATFRMGGLKFLWELIFGIVALLLPLILLILLGFQLEAGWEKTLLLLFPSLFIVGLIAAIIYLARTDTEDDPEEQNADETTAASLPGKWVLVKVGLFSYFITFASYGLYFRSHVPKEAFFVSWAYKVYLKVLTAFHVGEGGNMEKATLTSSGPSEDIPTNTKPISGRAFVAISKKRPLAKFSVDSVRFESSSVACFVRLVQTERNPESPHNWLVYLWDDTGTRYRLVGSTGIPTGTLSGDTYLSIEPGREATGMLRFMPETKPLRNRFKWFKLVLMDVIKRTRSWQLTVPLRSTSAGNRGAVAEYALIPSR